MHPERRLARRVPVRVYVNEHVGARVIRSLALDMSEGGMAVRRLVGPGPGRDRVVEVEMVLAGGGETIWAEAETRFEAGEGGGARAGLRFVSLPRSHQRLLRDFLADRRLRGLEPRPPRRWLGRLAHFFVRWR